MTWFPKKTRPFISSPTGYSSSPESREPPSPEANADGKATAEDAQEPGGCSWAHSGATGSFRLSTRGFLT